MGGATLIRRPAVAFGSKGLCLMGDDQTSALETARRLQAIMELLGIKTVREFAQLIGCKRSQASNWLQGYNYPRVSDMAALCDKMNDQIDLDYIYRGKPNAVAMAVYIHLTGILEHIPAPAGLPEEPKSRRDYVSLKLTKGQARDGRARGAGGLSARKAVRPKTLSSSC